MLLIALLKNEYFPADHHLDDHVVLLEGLQLVVDVLALQYVGLHAHAQGHSHLAGNFLACLCFSSQFAKTSYIVFFGSLYVLILFFFHFFGFCGTEYLDRRQKKTVRYL